jgi:hypothetical protein
MSHVYFFQLTDEGGKAAVKLGMLERNTTTGHLKGFAELGGKGLRVYIPEGKPGEAHGLEQFSRLATKGPLMAREAVTWYAKPAQAEPLSGKTPDRRRKGQTADTKSSIDYRGVLYGWLNADGLVAHQARPLMGSGIKGIESWLQDAGPDQMVVEVDANADAIETLNRYFTIEFTRTLKATDAPERAGSVEDLTAAATRRADLAEPWFTATEVAGVCGSKAENARQMASRLRRNGEILGVWMAPENRYKYPDYQFTAEGIVPEMKRLLALLPKGNGSGWAQAQWLNTPHALLEKQRPSEVLSTDPGRVLEVARKQFSESRDALW